MRPSDLLKFGYCWFEVCVLPHYVRQIKVLIRCLICNTLAYVIGTFGRFVACAGFIFVLGVELINLLYSSRHLV